MGVTEIDMEDSCRVFNTWEDTFGSNAEPEIWDFHLGEKTFVEIETEIVSA